MAPRKQPVSKWFDGSTPLDELSQNEQLAHQIVTERGDLGSSVVRIMDAELSDAGQLQALEAFHDSIGSVDDPNRDPRVAIKNAEKV